MYYSCNTSLPSVDASVSEFLKANVLKKEVTSFSKSSNLFFILFLTREEGLIIFSVLPTISFHIARLLTEIRNVHLYNLTCGFL